ncbi:MAG: paraquat-inducible protein A [Desulfobacteraceae bacterium]
MPKPNLFGQEDLIGCPDCDLLVKKSHLKKGYNLACPRCGALLLKSRHNSIDRTLALSLSGLLLFFPACFLPLLNFKVLGYSGKCTMVKAAVQMFASGYWWMGFLVLFCSILVPFIVLCILFFISFSAKMGRYPAIIVKTLKAYHHLAEWTMLDVYMLGILISLIKMKDYGEIYNGLGLYSFIGLLAMVILTMLSFDSHHVWEQLEGNS